jgi:hypothetical protein
MDFENHGGNLSTSLTIFKIALAWALVAAYLAMVFVDFLSMRQVSQGKVMHEFHELVEIQPPPTPQRQIAKARPYSSTVQLPQANPSPAIQVLPVSSRAWI